MNHISKNTSTARNDVTCEPATEIASKSKARIVIKPLPLRRTFPASLGIGLLLATSLFAPSALAQPKGVAKKYAPDSVIVRFKEDSNEDDRTLARFYAKSKHSEKIKLVPGLEVLSLEKGQSVEETVKQLKNDPNVLYAEPDYIRELAAVPNDPRFAEQWGLRNIKASEAWESGYQITKKIAVAVIDTGIDFSHPDLRDNKWINPDEIPGDRIDNDSNGYIDDVYGWDFVNNDAIPADDIGHGTHVAGIIGAAGNNGVGVSGVAWKVKLVALKIFKPGFGAKSTDIVKAIQYAVSKGIKVSNNSYGGINTYSQAEFDAINSPAARRLDHVFVAAAGNDGLNTDSYPHYPSGYKLSNIISVANINSSGQKNPGSNYGVKSVDLGAPGTNILSTTPLNSYASWSGTSMAAPFVAGAAAMLFEARPWWRYENLVGTLLSTSRKLDSMAGKAVTGGTLDLAAAVGYALTTKTPNQTGFMPPLWITSYVHNVGWRYNMENLWVAYKDHYKYPIKQLKIEVTKPEYSPNLNVEIRCRNIGGPLYDWRTASQLCGKTVYGGLSGFGLRLTGTAAAQYTVVYTCNIPGLGDRGPYKDGETCGSVLSSARYIISAVKVTVMRK